MSESDQRAATSLFARLPSRPDTVVAPTHKQLAEQHGLSVGTAHRVTALLSSEGLIRVSRGRRATVSWIGDYELEIREPGKENEDPKLRRWQVG